MKCIECAGELTEKTKTYVANLDSCVIIIKNVPALVCESCGEVYYSDEVFERIETIVEKLKNFINDIAVIDYAKSAA
ncbi:MAG: type II toxin-antitoxin system MqsA family antitoxin [Firmicutes bacterium]|nr:type II toxin-antitoxin system MqsA family antitoxin [Bacillota bacterium]